jgi:hypothetical protein
MSIVRNGDGCHPKHLDQTNNPLPGPAHPWPSAQSAGLANAHRDPFFTRNFLYPGPTGSVANYHRSSYAGGNGSDTRNPHAEYPRGKWR